MSRGRPKKRWVDSVKEVMARKGASGELVSESGKLKKKIHCTDLK